VGEGGISGQDRDEMSQGGSDPPDPPFLKIRLVTPWLILGKGGPRGSLPLPLIALDVPRARHRVPQRRLRGAS